MRHIFAAVLGVLAAVASYQSNVVRSGGQYPGWQIDVAFAVAIWVGIVYLIAFYLVQNSLIKVEINRLIADKFDERSNNDFADRHCTQNQAAADLNQPGDGR